jgi:hypothetical protein
VNVHLANTTALYAGFLGVWALAASVLRRPRGRAHRSGLVLLELAAIVQVGLSTVGLLGGHRPAELGTLLGYLVASIVVLPLVVGSAAGEDGPWAGAIVGVGCVALAVVALRLKVTWAVGGPGA